MSVVGVGIVVGTIALLVGLGSAIDRGGAVGLIAGYRAGELPPEREDELARDVRNVLFVTALSLVPLLVQFAGRDLPAVVHAGVPVAVPLVLSGWLVWKWNLGADRDADGEF